MGSFLAAIIDESTLALAIPLLALLIPIVVILSKHQQKMAMIIHGQAHFPELENEVRALRHELQQLQYQMGQQNLALDQLRGNGGATVPVAPPVAAEGAGLQERVGF